MNAAISPVSLLRLLLILIVIDAPWDLILRAAEGPPGLLSYQGRMVVDGVNFEGTGQFKFALIDGPNGPTLWSNDGTEGAGAEPQSAVPLEVTKGHYGVLLGDTQVPGMTAPISPDDFATSDVRLRVWFRAAAQDPWQVLAPDQRIASVGYAHMAGTVADGSLTAAKLAPGAIGNAQLPASPTFSGPVFAEGFIGSGAALLDLDASRVTQGELPDARLSPNVVVRGPGGGIAATFLALTGGVTVQGSPFLRAVGASSTFLGIDAGEAAVPGESYNTGIGQEALVDNTTGKENTALGASSLSSNTVGEGNTGLGYRALRANNNGVANTAVGRGAMERSVSGQFNTAIGEGSQAFSINDSGNTSVGYAALGLTQGSENTAVGYGALGQGGIAAYNAALGVSALKELLSGNDNIAIGHSAGKDLVNGSSNIYLGNRGIPDESHVIRIGNAEHTDTYLAGTVHGTFAGTFAAGSVSSASLAEDPGSLARVSGGSLSVLGDGLLSTLPISAVRFNGSGEGLSNLNASQLTAGTVEDARLSSNVVLRSSDGTLSASRVTFPGGLTLGMTNGNAGIWVDHLDPQIKDTQLMLINQNESNTLLGWVAGYSLDAGAAANTGVGYEALFLNSSGDANTAVGVSAMRDNKFGGNNTAVGAGALSKQQSGIYNTAVGTYALEQRLGTNNNNTALGGDAMRFADGDNNTAVGISSLSGGKGNGNVAAGSGSLSNIEGSYNIGVGADAMKTTTNGDHNIGIGQAAGFNLLSGSYNIYVGSYGKSNESNTIRIGGTLSGEGSHSRTFIAGIAGTTVAAGATVRISSDGQLGTITSSRRFKEEIRDMGAASDILDSLRPVTFRYRTNLDPARHSQYGLIAEEVHEVAPELVIRDAEGEIQSVRYEAVNAMLLNEFQKEKRRVATLEEEVRELKIQLTALAALMQQNSGVPSAPQPATNAGSAAASPDLFSGQ